MDAYVRVDRIFFFFLLSSISYLNATCGQWGARREVSII